MKTETLFRVLGDGTRRRVLMVLNRHELSVSELVEVLNQPQSTVSRHLRVLKDAALIRDRRNGSTVMYSVRPVVEGGNGSELAGRVIDWITSQEVPSAIRARLAAVTQRRRGISDEFFARTGRQWDSLREEAFGPTFHLEAFWGLLPRDWKVADVGTGTGYLLPALARHFEHVTGVDPVEEMLVLARRRVEEAGVDNVEFRKGDLSALPLEDRSVDLAIAVLVLHHAPHHYEALRQMHRIVRQGGRILIVEQCFHVNESFRLRMQDQWWGFAPNELIGMVETCGFEEAGATKLVTVEQAEDAPELFVLTAKR